MSILIKRATVISMDEQRGAVPFSSDILIEGGPHRGRRDRPNRPADGDRDRCSRPPSHARVSERSPPFLGGLVQGAVRQYTPRTLDALFLSDTRVYAA